MHGARFLLSKNVFRRGFWTVLLILSSGYCFFQIYAGVIFYYQRPFNTKITNITPKCDTSLPFPAVTLCNLNLFNLLPVTRLKGTCPWRQSTKSATLSPNC